MSGERKIIETYFVPGFFDQCSGLPIKPNPNSKKDGLYGYWIARLKHSRACWHKGATESEATKNLIANLHIKQYEIERVKK